MSNTKKQPDRRREKSKLARLPQNARVSKRPLLHAPLPSPYAGSASQKVVYISAKTPFMSAIKRIEKLLHLSDKRLLQSAAKLAQDRQYWKRRRGSGDGDEIEAIAEVAEEQKRRKTGDVEGVKEEVVVKGSGKAIPKVMEVGVWFQQRGEEYNVRVKTGSVSSIDDVEYERGEDAGAGAGQDGEDAMDVDEAAGTKAEESTKTVSESRIRKVSVLGVYVSLR